MPSSTAYEAGDEAAEIQETEEECFYIAVHNAANCALDRCSKTALLADPLALLALLRAAH